MSSDQNEEQIRKLFVKDVKIGADVHTVFKAVKKSKVTARSGKVFLSLLLVDKTGELDARVFDNIEAAEGAFTEGDYLLVKGRTIAFHGKPQLVLDTIERIDAGPIDAAEFAYVAPPPTAERERIERPERAEKNHAGHRHHRLIAALEDERVLDGLDAFFKHLDQYIDERVQARVQSLMSKGERPERSERNDRGPRSSSHGKPKVEHKPSGEEKKEPTRDPGLPKELSFKPFSMLTQEPAAAENSSKPPSDG